MVETGRVAELLLRNLQRAAELVRGFKQVAVHQSTDAISEFDVRTEIESVLLSLHPEVKRRPLSIELECPEGLLMRSFPGALGQILTNLVMNSLVHAFGGRESGRIRIEASGEGGELCLDYADDGVGMNAEGLARIFEPFYTTRRGSGGTGLGMHIVYNLATHKLGGRIRVESPPGEGLRVALQVPLRLDASS